MIGISYSYSAPEINIYGKSKVSEKSDIFSFGMFFFILILILF